MDQAAIDRGDFVEEPEVEETPVEAVEPEVEVEEPEVETPEPEVEETPRDEKGRFAGIPKARFDEAVGKEREARESAERRAAELERQLVERQQTQAKTEEVESIETRITELEGKYQDLLIDGQTKEAADVMRQMRLAERQIARIEAQNDARATTTQLLESERFELSVAKLEAEHPQLNPKSEVYDNDLVEMILDRQSRLMQQGLTPSKAIAEATTFIMGRAAAREQPEAEQGLGKAKVSDRKQEQVAKNLQAQKQQPPSTREVGLDSDKIGEKALPNINQMTAEEFAALPASTKARLRGDLG